MLGFLTYFDHYSNKGGKMIFIKLNQMKKPYHQGQVSIFFIAIIATLISYAFLTVSIGKMAIYQTRSDNGADAGALAAAAVMATGFNYVSNENGGDRGQIQGNTRAAYGSSATRTGAPPGTAPMRNDIQNTTTTARMTNYTGAHIDNMNTFNSSSICCGQIGPSSDSVNKMDGNGGQYAGQYTGFQTPGTILASDNTGGYAETIRELQDKQTNNFQTIFGPMTGPPKSGAFVNDINAFTNFAVRDSGTTYRAATGGPPSPADVSYSDADAGDASGGMSSNGQSSMYSLAVYAGIMYNLYNTLNPGGDELGRFNKKYYEKWLGAITPETVMSGKPEVFVWVDGAARVHIVMVMIEDQCPNNFSNSVSQESGPQAANGLRSSGILHRGGMSSQGSAGGNYATGCSVPCLNEPMNAAGDGNSGAADGFNQSGNATLTQVVNGQRNTKPNQTSMSQQLRASGEVLHNIEGIAHSQQVFSMSFQFHMPSPIKGMRRQIDEMTIAWPQISISHAGFSGNGGNIRDSRSNFDGGIL
jgi:hypothetical protein